MMMDTDTVEAPLLGGRSETASTRAHARTDARPTFLQKVEPDEQILHLVRTLFLSEDVAAKRAIVFAGIEHGVGCSQMAMETAQMLAKSTGSACLLETNFRSPSLARTVGMQGRRGWTDVVDGRESIVELAEAVGTDGLWIVPAGIASLSPGQLATGYMRTMLEELKSRFHYVVIDAPPFTCPETQTITQAADGTVMVLEAGRTRRTMAAAMTSKLRRSGANIVAAVLNKRSFAIPQRVYDRL